MKTRFVALGAAICLAATLVGGFGAYLKYKVILPLDLPEYSQKSVFELPFIYYTDEALQFIVENWELMQGEDETEPPQTDPPTNPTAPSVPTEPIIPTDTSIPTIEPDVTTDPPTELPTEPVKPEEPTFDFQGVPVDSGWFDDVLFVGDSRVDDLKVFARNGNADYFADVGMTVFTVNSKTLSDKSFPAMKFAELLEYKQYGKIYLAFGINETGWPLQAFKLKYKALIEQIRTAQPNAVIIVQSIIPTTKAAAEKEWDYLNLDNINAMNQFIRSLDNGTDIFFVDPNPYFTNSEGYLYSSITGDGWHPKYAGYCKLRDWISYAVSELGIS